MDNNKWKFTDVEVPPEPVADWFFGGRTIRDAEERSEWIDNNLPAYLVCIKFGRQLPERPGICYYAGEENWITEHGFNVKVYAWQELPEVPKETESIRRVK